MPPRSRLRSWLWRASLAVLALLVVLVVLETFVAERWWATTLVTYAPQHPVLPLPALLFATAVVLRHWRAAVVNALGLAVALFALLGVHVPLHGAPRSAETPLRVMTYNIERYVRAKPEQIRALAERERVDVLCVQEAHPIGSQETSPDLLRAFAGWHQAACGEVAVFSRYPIIRRQPRQLPGTGRPVMEAEIDYRGRQVTLLDVHFSVAMLPESLKSHRGSLASYLRHTADVRLRQAAAVLDVARQIDGPLLVAGDFNTPPRGLVYRGLAAQLQDGFAARGWGAGNTYSARRPLLRIDYVFARAPAHVIRCRVLPERRLSDHRPLFAEITFGQDATSAHRRPAP